MYRYSAAVAAVLELGKDASAKMCAMSARRVRGALTGKDLMRAAARTGDFSSQK